MKKTLSHILLPVLLCTLLCSCRNGQADGSGHEATDSTVLRIAVMPTLDCLPLYCAERCGIFDEVGAEVQLLTYRAQMDVDTAIARGHADVAYTDLVRAALLQSRGTGLYAIMQAAGHHELLTAHGKRINNIRHLKEKMVAMARHSVTDLLLDTVIYAAQLDPSAVYHPQINDIGLRCSMLDNGTIDAAFLPEPYITQSRLQGHRSIFDSRKQNVRLLAFAASQQAVSNERTAAQIGRMIEAYNLSADRINSGALADSIRVVLLDYPVRPVTADSLTLPVYTHAQPVNAADLATALRFLRGRGLTEDSYSGDTLINTQFIR